MDKICVIGLGYIGLPTSVMFAKHGLKVVGVDISETVVDTLNKGVMHIEEPGLGELLLDVVEQKMFVASTKPDEADAFIIAVPTPNKNDHYKSCDLSYVLDATQSILPFIKKGNSLIVESTISPRTINDYIVPLVEEAGFIPGKDIFLAHCPERVLPGKIIEEMIHNDRIVGGYTEECANRIAELYRVFVEGEIVVTNAKTAEMSKLMENTFRDVNIALANELSKVCHRLNINVLDVIEMANKHPRVNIHTPGPGVGGHCLAVDPYFIIEKAPELARLITMARDTNKSMPYYVVEKVEKVLEGINDPKVTILGVTYKGNIDDMRESPANEIIEMLTEKGIQLSIHDPHVNAEYMVSMEDGIEESDLALILADHSEFKYLDSTMLKSKMRTTIIYDTKNVVMNKDDLTALDIEYYNFGNLYKL